MSIVKSEYNNFKSIITVEDQKDPWVMYLIVRESLNMSIGKVSAQCGHAVGLIYNYFDDLKYSMILDEEKFLEINNPTWDCIDKFNLWQKSSFRKIVKKADDKEWEKIKQQLECHLVIDAGLTEIPSNSETCIALWPVLKSHTPPLVKRLRLL